MLLAISITTAVNIENNNEKRKISPLFNIRINKAINKEKKIEIVQNIMNKLFKNRIFYFPFKGILNKFKPFVIGTQGFPVTECNTCKCQINNQYPANLPRTVDTFHNCCPKD